MAPRWAHCGSPITHLPESACSRYLLLVLYNSSGFSRPGFQVIARFWCLRFKAQPNPLHLDANRFQVRPQASSSARQVLQRGRSTRSAVFNYFVLLCTASSGSRESEAKSLQVKPWLARPGNPAEPRASFEPWFPSPSHPCFIPLLCPATVRPHVCSRQARAPCTSCIYRAQDGSLDSSQLSFLARLRSCFSKVDDVPQVTGF